MRRAAKKDISHNPIKQALEEIGFSVMDTHQLGEDKPDMVVSRSNKTALVECKTGNKKLMEGQDKFRLTWRGVFIKANKWEDVAYHEYFN